MHRAVFPFLALFCFFALMWSSSVGALTSQGADVQLELRVTELEARVDRVVAQVNKLDSRVTELQEEISLLKKEPKPSR